MAYLFVFSISFNLYAQPFSVENERAYNQIISLNFKAPETRDHKILSPTEAYLLHFHYSLQFLFTEDQKYLALLDASTDHLINIIENSSSPPFKDFLLSEIKLQSAFINLKTGNELAAAWQIRQAYKLIIKNHNEYPDFVLNKKTLGLLHVMIGAIPQQYQWVIGLMGMEGNVEQGMEELKKVAESESIYKLEAEILQAVIRSFILDETETASKEALAIIADHQENTLLKYIGTALLLKNNSAKEAEALISTANKEKLPLLHYQAGEVYLQLGEYNKAESALKSFLASYKGVNFVKDAYYKLFLATWLNGHEIKAKEFFNKGREVGQTLTEADKHAARILQEDKFPNRIIMKIRLYTDGGEFKKAKSLVNSSSSADFKRSEDILEFTYRKARLYHKTHEIQIAENLYKQVIEQQAGNQYFAPNSCLQLGYIYAKKGQDTLAREYFEKALAYRNHEYKNSIDNKGKAALKLLDYH